MLEQGNSRFELKEPRLGTSHIKRTLTGEDGGSVELEAELVHHQRLQLANLFAHTGARGRSAWNVEQTVFPVTHLPGLIRAVAEVGQMMQRRSLVLLEFATRLN
jgi:hypothetical protein